MSKLGTVIAKDIENMLSGNELEGVLTDVANLYEISAERLNEKAQNPDGSKRLDLKDMYKEQKESVGKNTIRDLDFTGRAKNTFDWDINTSSKSIGFGWDDDNVINYMRENQNGDGKAVARFFPSEMSGGDDTFDVYDDKDSPPQKDNKREVEHLLEEHLNKERTLVVK